MGLLDFLGGQLFSGEGQWKAEIQKLIDQGLIDQKDAAALSGGALDDIRGSIGDYTSKLQSGNVLPVATQRAYALAKGRIRDTAARETAASGAGIAQRQLQSGMSFSPAAAEEYQSMATRDIADREFGAETNIGIEEGRTTMSESDKLMDRLDALKGTVLNYGQFAQQLAQREYMSGIMAKMDRRKAMTGGGFFSAGGGMQSLFG